MKEKNKVMTSHENKSFAHGVLRNISFNIFSTFLDRLGGLILTILLARILMPELFGVYSLTLSITLLLLTIADLGLGQTLIRFVSDSLKHGKKGEKLAREYFIFISKIRIFSVIIFSVLLLLFSGIIANLIFKKPELILPFKFASLYLFFATLLDTFAFTFYAVKKVKFYVFKEAAFQVTRIILAPILAIYLSEQYKVPGVFIALTIASALALFVVLILIKKRYPFFFSEKQLNIDKKRVLKFTLFLAVISLSSLFFAYIDSVMLGLFLPIEYVGYYRIAFMIVSSVASLTLFLNVIMPIFTQLEGQNLVNAFKKVFHFTSILTFPTAFGLALVAAPFIKLAFGDTYLPAVFPLYFLSFLIIETSLLSYFSLVFQAKEKPQIPTYATIVATILNVILNYVLITKLVKISYEYAMAGSAIATLITRFSLAIFVGIAAYKKFGLKIQASSILKPLVASLVMSTILLLFFKPTSLSTGILEIFIGAAIYFLILFLIKGIKKDDFIYFKNLIKK